MKRIAFYGNSCTGKTTSMYEIANHLTKQGKSFRIINMPFDNSGHAKNNKPFDASKMETIEARLYFLFDQMAEENKAFVRDEVDYLLCEMTAMDLLYMHEWVCEIQGCEQDFNLAQVVIKHCQTYDYVFSLPDTDYYDETDSRGGSFIKHGLAPLYRKYQPVFSRWTEVSSDIPVEGRCQRVLAIFKELNL